jgi:hypothetical protein
MRLTMCRFPQLALLGALLVATVLPLETHGSPLSDLVAGMTPGTWAELQTSNMTATFAGTGSSLMTIGYAHDLKWDPVGRRLYYTSSDHGDHIRHIVYDEATNTWSYTIPPFDHWCCYISHELDHSAIDPDRRTYYHRPLFSPIVWRYDLDTETWSELPPFDYSIIDYPSCCVGIEYFPEANGLIWASPGAPFQVARFDFDLDEWLGFARAPEIGNLNIVAYHPAHQALLIAGGTPINPRAMYKLSADGAIVRLQDAPIDLAIQLSIITADPSSEEFVVLTGIDPTGEHWAYHMGTDTWRQLPSPTPMITGPYYIDGTHGVLGASLASHGVIGYVRCHYSDGCHFWIYKHLASSLERTTSTQVSCVPSIVAVDQASACTATVTDTDSGPATTPGGAVSFTATGAGGTPAATSCTLAAGQCTVSFTGASPGTISVTATYGGDAIHQTSSGAAPITVTATARTTATQLACTPASTRVGQASACTATVADTDTGAGSRPGGTVSFTATGAGASPGTTSCMLAAGQCTVSFSGASTGRIRVTASYAGDATHETSSDADSVRVKSSHPR